MDIPPEQKNTDWHKQDLFAHNLEIKYQTPQVKKEALASADRILEEYKNPIVKRKGSET